MRVITGSARGTRLETPEGAHTRPTTDMVKEAVFSIIQFQVEQAAVLDLFAGSGQLGVEALSRGAKSCVFVDQDRGAQQVILRNLQAAKLADRARVAAMDAAGFLATSKDLFDIALLDPPYDQKLIDQVLDAVAAHMQEDGIILCETGKLEQLPARAGSFEKHKTYRYGRVLVTSYRRAINPDT